MESSPTAIAHFNLRNLFTSLFFYADNPLVFLAEKYRLLELLRCFLLNFSFLSSTFDLLFPGLNSSVESYNYSLKTNRADSHELPLSGGVSAAEQLEEKIMKQLKKRRNKKRLRK